MAAIGVMRLLDDGALQALAEWCDAEVEVRRGPTFDAAFANCGGRPVTGEDDWFEVERGVKRLLAATWHSAFDAGGPEAADAAGDHLVVRWGGGAVPGAGGSEAGVVAWSARSCRGRYGTLNSRRSAVRGGGPGGGCAVGSVPEPRLPSGSAA
jgi:hypothetical protein